MKSWMAVLLVVAGCTTVGDVCRELAPPICERSVECGISGNVDRCIPGAVDICCGLVPCASPSPVSEAQVEACGRDLRTERCDALWMYLPDTCIALLP